MKSWRAALVFLLLFGLVIGAIPVFADLGASMSSDNFRILDAQHAAFGGIASSSSTSFHLLGAIGDIAIGSSSADTFILQGGFLTFLGSISSAPSPTPTQTPTTTPPPNSGGGYVTITADVSLSGYAYPRAKVYILRDAMLLTTISATDTGIFAFEDLTLPLGTYKYSIYGVDTEGRRSSNLVFFVTLDASGRRTIDRLIIPPTLSLDRTHVTRTDMLVAHGQAFPGSYVVAEILYDGIQVSAIAVSNGGYSLSYPASKLTTGIHGIRAKMVLSPGAESMFSTVARFGVGVPFIKRIFDIPHCGPIEQPDLNCDARLNVVDISIMMYYWKRPLPTEAQFVDLNGDGVVDIIDFSILAFYWTG